MWSDESGLKECTKGSTQPPSPQWSWVGLSLLSSVGLRPVGSSAAFCVFSCQVSEWAVDHSVPGGTDKDGWQYAADFPTYVPHFGSILFSAVHAELEEILKKVQPFDFPSAGRSTVTKPSKILSGAGDGRGNGASD